MKKILIVTGCYNEEDNLLDLYDQIMQVAKGFAGKYFFEIIITDNASTDRSPQILRELAKKDRNVKVIFNSRNFGPDRSGYNAIMQAYGDAVVTMASDLQDPLNEFRNFLQKW
jgi:glycosyltransferase involved in cell wall biosynthesis